MAKKSQWHPAFVEMLRPVVASHFDVQPDLPVGDKPREADIVLLRRKRRGRLPFTGLWKDLTAWNVLEFKGPTVSPRDEDADDLIEVGLGIFRRLNDERRQRRKPALAPAEVSFWYLANRLGRRLLRGWEERRFGGLRPHGQGVWRCEVMGRSVYLVSGSELPVEEDSLPLHLIGKEPPETERAVAEFLVAQEALWERFSGWLAAFHLDAYKGVESMAKTTKGGFNPTLEGIIDTMGVEWVLQQVGVKRMVEQVGVERMVEQVGVERMIEQVGVERVVEQLSADAFLARLTPEQRQRLKERLG